MHCPDRLGFAQIGDCTRYPQDSLIGAGRQAQAIHGLVEQLVVAGVEPAEPLDFRAG